MCSRDFSVRSNSLGVVALHFCRLQAQIPRKNTLDKQYESD